MALSIFESDEVVKIYHEDGTDLFTVKELLGHADYAMAARYSHVGAESLRTAVKRLSKPPADKFQVVQLHD